MKRPTIKIDINPEDRLDLLSSYGTVVFAEKYMYFPVEDERHLINRTANLNGTPVGALIKGDAVDEAYDRLLQIVYQKLWFEIDVRMNK